MAVIQSYPRRCRNGKCRSTRTAVIATRDYPKYVYRQRECLNCGTRWPTYEIIWPGRGASLINHLTNAGHVLIKMKQLLKDYSL